MMKTRLTRQVLWIPAVALSVCLFVPLPAVAQQTGSISGTVTVAGTGQPLPMAQVQVLRVDGMRLAARQTTAAGPEGRFRLSDVPAGRLTLRARMVGFSTGEATVVLPAGRQTEVHFELSRSVILLDEIVVTGAAGPAERRQLGNTVVTIDATELEDAPVTSFSELLQGREPSVVGLPSSGLAGEGTRIRIRGSNSMAMSNEPMVYVDGIRVDNAGGLIAAGGGGSGSRLDDINPDAIERIEVLKGAAAATLYGSEASSGIIQIFTKRGQPGRPRFNARIEQGFSRYPDRFQPNAGFARDSATAATMSDLYGFEIEPYEIVERTFVRDMFGTGRHHTYSLDVSGGSNEVQYFASGRWSNERGPLDLEDLGPSHDGVRRVQGNANVTLFPRERLSFRISTAFTDAKQQILNNNNERYAPVLNALGGKPERANCYFSSVDSTRVRGATTPVCTGAGNPTGSSYSTVRQAVMNDHVQETEHFRGSVSTSYVASEALELDVILGLDATNETAVQFVPYGANLDYPNQEPLGGFRTRFDRNQRELTAEFSGRWTTRLGQEVEAVVTAGGQGFVSESERVEALVGDFGAPGLETLGAAAVVYYVDEAFESVVNLGLFSQAQFGYRDFAFLTLGGRWDRNSAFGKSAGAAFYPKASASVMVSDLMSGSPSQLSTLRVRAAIGESGLQPGAFDKLTTYGPVASSQGPGFSAENVGNPDLAPERTREIEIGGELGLLDDRIGLDVTYWDRVTRDALIPRSFPAAGGFRNTQLDNIGRLEAHGWEFKVNALVLDGADVSVNLWGNAAFLRELVADMGGTPPIDIGYVRYRNSLVEGYAPGTFFGVQLIPICGPGVERTCYTPGQTVPLDTDENGAPDTLDELGTFLTGSASIPLGELSPLLDDADGDLDSLDHALGKPTPDWQGSFGADVTIGRNLRISSLFEYRLGNFGVSNLSDAFRRSDPFLGRNVRATAEVESTLLNPATQSDAAARVDAALIWVTELLSLDPYSGLNLVENGNFVRWRELSVSYEFPGSFADRLGFESVAMDAKVRNLHIWTAYSGVAPEGNALGRCRAGAQTINCNFLENTDVFTLPLPRRFSLAVRFGF